MSPEGQGWMPGAWGTSKLSASLPWAPGNQVASPGQGCQRLGCLFPRWAARAEDCTSFYRYWEALGLCSLTAGIFFLSFTSSADPKIPLSALLREQTGTQSLKAEAESHKLGGGGGEYAHF